MIKGVKFQPSTVIANAALVNLYGCTIGPDTRIAAFVEIGTGVTIGARCKVGAFSFIPPGVTIGDGVFIGPRVTFTNDKHPRAVDDAGEVIGAAGWEMLRTVVRDRAVIGAGSVILPGLVIGEGAIIGAGSVVTKSVGPGEVWHGEGARARR